MAASPSFSFSSTSIPGWLEGPASTLAGKAQYLLGQPNETYGGEYVAPLSATQQQAGQLIQSGLGQGQPAYNAAQQSLMSNLGVPAPTITPDTIRAGLGDIGAYYNPYERDVVQAAEGAQKTNLAKVLQQIKDASRGSSAYGSSRQGVQEGAAGAESATSMATLLASLRQQGYDRATALLGQDVGTRNAAKTTNASNLLDWLGKQQTGASTLANVAGQTQAGALQDVNNLLGFGGLEQSTGTAQRQAAYQEWLRQLGWPTQQIATLGGALQGLPHGTTTTSFGQPSQQETSSNGLMGGLGGAMAGAQLGSMFPGVGTGIGAVTGGLLGFMNR